MVKYQLTTGAFSTHDPTDPDYSLSQDIFVTPFIFTLALVYSCSDRFVFSTKACKVIILSICNAERYYGH